MIRILGSDDCDGTDQFNQHKDAAKNMWSIKSIEMAKLKEYRDGHVYIKHGSSPF